MKTFTFVTLAVAVAAAVTITACKSDSSTSSPTGYVPSASHGQYLVKNVASCGDCHTPYDAMGMPIDSLTLAGGERFDLGPAGAVYARNITQDTTYGIGKWTDLQIRTAIRTGIVPMHTHNGVMDMDTVLVGVMPYQLFANLTDSDVMDVVAYLRTIKAVAHVVPMDTVAPGVRTAGPKITLPDASVVDASTTRGKYIAAVGLCADCHTPLTPIGAPDMTQYLAGGRGFDGIIPGVTIHTANITPDTGTGIGKWTAAQIKTALTTGVDDQGRHLCPPMPWQNFKSMTSTDLDAIIAYIQHVPALVHKVPENPDCMH